MTGDNVLTVRCDTDPKDTTDCLPSGTGTQLYHVYGGLYRRVWLLKTAPVHIDPTDDASSGLYLTPQTITADDAALVIKTLVRNDGFRAEDSHRDRCGTRQRRSSGRDGSGDADAWGRNPAGSPCCGLM